MTLGDVMKFERDERRFDFHDIGLACKIHIFYGCIWFCEKLPQGSDSCSALAWVWI